MYMFYLENLQQSS